MSRIIKLGDTFTKREVLEMFGINPEYLSQHRYDLGEKFGGDFAGKFLSFYFLPEHVFGTPPEERKLQNTYVNTLSADGEIFANETKDGMPRPEYGEGEKYDERGKTLILFTSNRDEDKRVYQGEFRFEKHEGDQKWIFKRMKTETKTPNHS